MAQDSQADILQLSMSNTKKEMLDAYGTVKALIESKEKAVLDADADRKVAEKQAALAAAHAETQQDPVRRIHDLRASISKELADLAEKFESELDNFKNLDRAVQEKKREQEDVYGIETAASDLAALIQAQRLRKDQFESNMGETEQNWTKQRQDFEKNFKEQQVQQRKIWQREQEEYDYTLNRDREQRKNALIDELSRLEKEMTQKRVDFEQKTAERETLLNEREVLLSEQEDELQTLRERAQSVPDERDAAVKSALMENERNLSSDFEKEKALMDAHFNGERNLLLSKIESLEKQVTSQAEELKHVLQRQERAYENIQDIAGKAVASAKREVIALAPEKSDGKS